MNLQSPQSTPNSAAADGTYPATPPCDKVFAVRRFSQRHPDFSEPSLRNLLFKARPRQSSKGEIPGNGLIEAGAILRVGRKVLIDEDRFFAWVRQQNEVR